MKIFLFLILLPFNFIYYVVTLSIGILAYILHQIFLWFVSGRVLMKHGHDAYIIYRRNANRNFLRSKNAKS